jgi:hypothetical protein
MLRVADEHAGKRVKCPVCNAVIAPSPPEPQFEVVEEPPQPQVTTRPKVRARVDDEDENGAGYHMEAAAKKPAPPVKKPQFRKRADAIDDDEDEDPRPRRRRMTGAEAGAAAGKRIAYVVGGIIGLVAGSALAIWAYSGTGRGSTKLMIFGGCIAIVGLISLIQGITGTIPEGD